MFGLGFVCGPILGGCSVHTGFGFLVLRLPADRRSAIDFAKANPFTALMALTKVQGIAA
jgi:hypothetical protein